MPTTEELNERYRAKIRARNLGEVEVRTYPSSGPVDSKNIGSISDVDARYLAKVAARAEAAKAPKAEPAPALAADASSEPKTEKKPKG